MLTLVSCISSDDAEKTATGDTPVGTADHGVSASIDSASADSAHGDVVSVETSDDFQYRLRGDGTAEIIEYRGAGGDLSIPSSLDGHTVVSIGGSWTFSSGNGGSLTIPDSVISIDPEALDSIEFERITVDQANPAYSCIDRNLYDKDETTLVRYATDRNDVSTVPDSVTCIESGAVEKCLFQTEVTIGSGVRDIQSDAFYGCSDMKEVTLPRSVTFIGSEAFGYYYDSGPDVDFTVKGYVGTDAERCAKGCNFTFVAIDG